jgi:hypothetical protein
MLENLCFRYIVTSLLIWQLNKRAILLPPKMGSLQFGGYLKSGKFFVFLSVLTLLILFFFSLIFLERLTFLPSTHPPPKKKKTPNKSHVIRRRLI